MKPLITLYAVRCHDQDPEFFISEEDARYYIEHSMEKYGEEQVEWYKENASIEKIEVADYRTVEDVSNSRHNMSRDEFLSRKISVLEKAFRIIDLIMRTPYVGAHTDFNREFFSKLDDVMKDFMDTAEHLNKQTRNDTLAHGLRISL